MADGSAPAGLRLATPIIEDLAYVARRMRPDEIEQYEAMTGAAYSPDVAVRSWLNTQGPMWAAVDDAGRAQLIGGFHLLSRMTAEGWLAGTLEGWERHWRAYTRLCRTMLDDLIARDVHRVQIVALASRTKAHDWYERGLGLKREGVLRRYCADGSDAVMFAKVR